MTTNSLIRCGWVPEKDPLYVEYHDKEWGVPIYEDRLLFEFLLLESMQAGLSWITILRKRENFRRAFDGFDPCKVAEYEPDKIDVLMQDAGIIRNKAKIKAAVGNARAFLEVQAKHGSFSSYIWEFVSGKPIVNEWKNIQELPASTSLSDAISADLKKRGFSFVGSTVVYSHMQATGMVNDHTIDCFRYSELLENTRRHSSE